MAKEVAAFIKLQIKGGAANPSPPVDQHWFKRSQYYGLLQAVQCQNTRQGGKSSSGHHHGLQRQVV